MSKKINFKKYFADMLVEYSKIVEMENRTWRF